MSLSTPSSPIYSLKARLLGFVMVAILLAALVQAATAYRGALQQADELFDDHLQQVARTLQRNALMRGQILDAQVQERLSEELLSEDGFDLYVQIWGQDGTPLFRSRNAALPPRAVLGFSDLEADGKRLRVYSLQTALQTVQIAQDLSARSARAESLAFKAVLPFVALTPLLMLAVWWVIKSALAPIERARAQVAQRAADDFSPLSSTGLPTEVSPLVDELNALFDRAHTAFEAQRNFVADAAHELRSPLTALKLQAQALRSGDGSGSAPPAFNPAQQADIHRLNQGIDRAVRLVEQLLSLAREDANTGMHAASGPGGPPTQVQLEDVIQQAVADVLPHAMHKHIDLGLADAAPTDAGAGPTWAVTGQRDALTTLLRNLLDNAVKYTPAGGRVDVSVVASRSGCTLCVEDSGPGIPEADHSRVFDRFYRLAQTTTTSASVTETGSGVGLSIVKVVAERHGATVTLSRSDRLGGLRVDVHFTDTRAAPKQV